MDRRAGGGGRAALAQSGRAPRRPRGEKALDPPRDLGRTSLTPSWSSFFPFNPRILLTLLQVSH